MARTDTLEYDPADYSDYLLERPTEEQLAVLKEGRLAPAADPLERGVVLAWDGPNLHPDALPPADYPRDPPEPSPHPPRPLRTSLLASNSPARGGAGWKLRLVEGIQTDEDNWSQVWRCKVVDEHGQDVVESVVLKLYQQSLFPLPRDIESKPEDDWWNWYPARHLVEREAQAYSFLQAYQGRDAPLCYGFYRLCAPCGEEVVGVVLEDLVEETISLWQHLKRETTGGRLIMDNVDELACAVLDAQHRFQNAGVIETNTDFDNILKMRNFPSLLVSVGFSKTMDRDMHLRQHEEFLERERKRGTLTKWDLEWNWRASDQALVRTQFDDVLAAPLFFDDWADMERKRRKLPYLDLP